MRRALRSCVRPARSPGQGREAVLIYFNELDRFAAAWLRNLFPAANIDERSITDVTPDDVAGFKRCHFFGGIGGWELALRLAGWPDDDEVWTGSCPCQPFSCAGRGKGTSDERHLWPEFRRLIRECRPPVVFGEQVASAGGRDWLSGVRADLEALGYAVGAADLCAPCAGEKAEGWFLRGDQIFWEPIVVGPPHIRQRLYWVADSGQQLSRKHRSGESPKENRTEGKAEASDESRRCGTTGRLVLSSSEGLEGLGRNGDDGSQPGRLAADTLGPVAATGTIGPWSDFDIVHCLDGKARRIESGTFPLAHGLHNRVGRLRGYGNAIVPQVAAEFIKAYMELRNGEAKTED